MGADSQKRKKKVESEHKWRTLSKNKKARLYAGVGQRLSVLAPQRTREQREGSPDTVDALPALASILLRPSLGLKKSAAYQSFRTDCPSTFRPDGASRPRILIGVSVPKTATERKISLCRTRQLKVPSPLFRSWRKRPRGYVRMQMRPRWVPICIIIIVSR